MQVEVKDMAAGSNDYDFIKAPEEYTECVCQLCNQVMVSEPHVTECCGQHYCHECLEQWANKDRQCPSCHSENFKHKQDQSFKRHINKLQVYCSNKVNGCQVATSLDQLETHLHKCDYAKLSCEQGCQTPVLRKDLKKHHAIECPKRTVRCPHCSLSGPYDVITQAHKQECPDYPVGCLKKCSKISKKIKRKDLNEHQKVCPLETITCTACQLQAMLRKDLEAHEQNDCPKRLVSCKYCEKEVPHDVMNDSHLKQCSDYPVRCPRGCDKGEQLKRKELKEHSIVCKLEPVKCPYFQDGCDVDLTRKDLEACLLYTSPSPRDATLSRMPSSA